MPRKKKINLPPTPTGWTPGKLAGTSSSNPNIKVVIEQPIQPLELNHGLHVTREEFNEAVGRLNEVIRRMK